MTEGIRIPLRHHDNRLLWPFRILVLRRWIPPCIDEVVLRIRRPLRRGKAQELCFCSFSLCSKLLDLSIFGKRFWSHIGRKQLRMPLFQTEVGGTLVAEEDVAVANEYLVDAHDCRFGGELVAKALRGRQG